MQILSFIEYSKPSFNLNMDILNNFKKFKDLDDKDKFYSYWTYGDDYSQSSHSSTSLSQDVDELKFIDDDSASSSSDEVYSLETSMIEMNSQDEKTLNENTDNSVSNSKYQHTPSPMIPRSSNFYDDTFTDDTLLQLSNKGFAQSLGKQAFVHNHSKSPEKPTISKGFLSHLKDGTLFDSYISSNIAKNSSVDSTILHNKLISTDLWLEKSFDLDNMDNDDLMSISSLGSDRSTTPVDLRSNFNFNEDSQQCLPDNTNKHDELELTPSQKHDSSYIKLLKPQILKFTDSEDIETLSPTDEILPITDGNVNGENEDEDDDKSTICGSENGDKEDTENSNSNEVFLETVYHQPPKAADRSAAKRLAKRLYQLDGFKMTDVSKHLSKRNDFSQLVGEEFANFFDFSGNTLDAALRKFLEKFILCGDTQERERVIHHFSRRYIQCNPNRYNCEESCHTLVCALMLLNTDLHGNSVNRKMSCEDFVVSMAELNNGENFDRDELMMLFNSILEKPIRWNVDNELIGLFQPKIDYSDISKQIHSNHLNLFLEVPSEATSKEYMSGYLLRKCIKESHYRRTSIGKRGWKLYFGRLQDLTLHLHKDEVSVNNSLKRNVKSKTNDNEQQKNGENCLDQLSTQNDDNNKNDKSPNIQLNGNTGKKSRKSYRFPRMDKHNSTHASKSTNDKTNSISNLPNSGNETVNSNVDSGAIGDTQVFLNHGFASKATDYSKKRNVFRLQVSNGSEYLFQVNEPKEVELWVDCINFVAALLSPPIFTSNCSKDSIDSSKNKTTTSLTSLNIKEQLESHQRCVLNLEQDLISLSSKPSCKSDKTKLKWQYNRQRKFIEKELLRYKTYAQLLEFEMIHLHNVTIARLSQQAFIDPYLVPIQYSQIPGSSPLFYNYQTNQFFPAINCVSTSIPVFQYHPSYTIPSGSINNSIKESMEENSSQGSTDPQNSVNMQRVIVRPSFTCNRNSRSQLGMNKCRRYRNIPIQPIVMQYPPSFHVSNSQNSIYGTLVPTHTISSNVSGSKLSTLHQPSVIKTKESLSPKCSGNLTSTKQSLSAHPNIQPTNCANNVSSNSRTFYEIL